MRCWAPKGRGKTKPPQPAKGNKKYGSFQTAQAADPRHADQHEGWSQAAAERRENQARRSRRLSACRWQGPPASFHARLGRYRFRPTAAAPRSGRSAFWPAGPNLPPCLPHSLTSCLPKQEAQKAPQSSHSSAPVGPVRAFSSPPPRPPALRAAPHWR